MNTVLLKNGYLSQMLGYGPEQQDGLDAKEGLRKYLELLKEVEITLRTDPDPSEVAERIDAAFLSQLPRLRELQREVIDKERIIKGLSETSEVLENTICFKDLLKAKDLEIVVTEGEFSFIQRTSPASLAKEKKRQTDPSLVTSLLPMNLVEVLKKEGLQEKPMLAIATLLINVVLRAIDVWTSGDIKKTDPNPGDGGCQLRAYLLYLLFSKGVLSEEALSLKKTMEGINDHVSKRKAKAPEGSAPVFFQGLFANITLTKQMEFLLQCYLLAVTRLPYQKLENGIVITRSDCSLLAKLSPKINDVPVEFRKKIVETAQTNLSASSAALLQEEASSLFSLDPKDKDLVLRMLSSNNTKVFTPNPVYEPKTFGCMFYQYKAILARLREEKTPVCFKSIVPPGRKPFLLLFEPRAEEEDFLLVPDQEYSRFPSESAMITFIGVIGSQYDRKSFAKKVEEIGFTNLILATAAIEPPYNTATDKKSVEEETDLFDITDAEAREEVLSFRNLARAIGCDKKNKDPFLELDHVYCASLAQEFKEAL